MNLTHLVLYMTTMTLCAAENANLLVNPQFDHLDSKDGPALYVAGWNVENRGDIRVRESRQAGDWSVVEVAPGKRFWQFIALADVEGEWKGVQVSLSAEVAAAQPQDVQVNLSLMGIESGEGTWIPAKLGPFGDKREFARHGRGELIVLDRVEGRFEDLPGSRVIKAEGLVVDWFFKEQKEADPNFRNAVGILVEFVNRSATQPILVRYPVLSKGGEAQTGSIPGREVPQWSRQIPRTMKKLLAGEPVYILTLGSSIDRGSANPRLYAYDENPESPTYRQPLVADKPFQGEIVGRPDLQDYVGWFQHYFMYTGRMRQELMRKYGYDVDGLLLNVMACDGSSIGESHSGFAEYAALQLDPAPEVNGHPSGKSWKELYPHHFEGGKTPVPDLVVFGHGHNERIDGADEIAVFEGAIRWFQRHYPEVEFVNCMWIRTAKDPLNVSMPKLCEHYGIPFIPANELIQHLRGTVNYYAIAPDGGHPQAAAHYLWFKQLEKAFESAGEDWEPQPQRHLPPRMNPFSYQWEGEIITFEEHSDRHFQKRMMVVEDGPFNLWAVHDNKSEVMKIRIDGQENKEAGRGRNYAKRDIRNSTFVYGRLEPGERHVVEIVGNNPRIVASDHKVPLHKQHFPAGHVAWKTALPAETYQSEWGYPYGTQCYHLKPGDVLTIEVDAELLSVAWLDQPEGGTLEVSVDGKPAWSQPTNIPYVDGDGNPHFIENRRAIRGLEKKPHTLQIRAVNGPVKLLSAYGYDPSA